MELTFPDTQEATMSKPEPMTELQLFLAHAMQLEREAAQHYTELAVMMLRADNDEVAGFFLTMADFSRRHLHEAMLRGGFHGVPHMDSREFRWPGGVSPEAVQWDSFSAIPDVQAALILALDGEHRGYEFYSKVEALTQNAEVRACAAEFASEEAAHVAELQKWLSRTPAHG